MISITLTEMCTLNSCVQYKKDVNNNGTSLVNINAGHVVCPITDACAVVCCQSDRDQLSQPVNQAC